MGEAMTSGPKPQVPPPSAPLLAQPPEDISLYVGDLDPQVTDDDLKAAFRFIGPVASVRVCRDHDSGESLRYAYANFYSHSHASKAMACLNHTELKGKTMRIMWSQRDPVVRKLGIANVFVKNLDTSVTSADLQVIFGEFGTILSCKVAEENGKSKGFGFVQFDNEDSAMDAISALHETTIKGKKLYVSKFVKKSERISPHDEPHFKNLYVKNLDEYVDEDLLQDLFSPYGKVSGVAIIKDDNGKSRGFGFVNFESEDDAKEAVDNMNGALLGSKTLFVGRAQKKAEREKLLKSKHAMTIGGIEKLRSSNLFVKNLADYVDETKLQEHFSAFGKITSVKVMRHDNRTSKGFGFVCFSTPEEADKALKTLNGTTFEGKDLYVAIAQRKEDRCKALEDNYAHKLSKRSLPPNWTAFHPFPPHPVQCPVGLSPPLSSLQHPSIISPHLYPPFLPQNYLNHFSSLVPSKPVHWSSTISRNENFQKSSRTYGSNSNFYAQDMNSANHGGIETGFRKKDYKKGGTTVSSRSVATGGRALVTETPTRNSKTTSWDPHHHLVQSLEHGRAAQIPGTSGMPLGMLNNTDKAAQAWVDNGGNW